jgi:hypothetical protein
MAVDVIRRFKASRLRSPYTVGPAFAERPREATYQDEFYRALFDVTKGATVISPEFSSGHSRGRIDFFIPSAKWGVEILREGITLAAHNARFDIAGAYGQWLAGGDMEDYIVLDFRTTFPRTSQTCKCFSPCGNVNRCFNLNLGYHKLLRVVFEDEFRLVSVMDENGCKVANFHLLEN